ncbi:MAG: hypothetical protein KDK12_13050 [Rhodobacteraceae bacterium]|nr:hypothetical protein [Paracoccaceae bacterium]
MNAHETHDLPCPGLTRPLTARWPADGPLAGAVVFCHGLGSNGREYAALSRHWAEHGYLVLHPTFDDAIALVAAAEPALGLDPTADLSRWTAMPEVRARMHQILHHPDSARARVTQAVAVIDALPALTEATAGGPVPPLAIAGHSFGAYTAQLLAGAVVDLPDQPNASFADPRITAAMLLSAQGRDQQGLRDGSWDRLALPALTVTGTRDMGAKGGDWHWKCEPFELAKAPEQYLAVLDEGDHFLGGFTETDVGRHVPAQAETLRDLTLTFLDAHLRGDPAARTRLRATSSATTAAPLLFKAR